ncbi:hypothetical protein GCM10007216_15010 [Thalassobacillus devorans]|uniref:Dehydrogenase n=1 Tax=Thalassobacillus devorans TaxID=279813 RepID=A0ABQ1NV00_9BACI|nr:Gfo/Idh/MocA family oxidoreductase [Thalassobacillus devorans]NIK28556.1 putative dehydrogenase [Thalassobacillus devorans]GGC85307.1 hypothetical protein GCM10007216_15010 [Thalassobacillus devorans]
MENIRLGLIGAGNRSRSLVKALKETGEAELVSYVDVTEKSHMSELCPNIKYYTSEHDMYGNEQLDAVVIATPNHMHHPNILLALHYELAIFAEKPLVHDLNQLYKIKKEILKSDSYFQVGTELRLDQGFTELRKRVQKCENGECLTLWCHEFRPPFKAGYQGWRKEQSSAGGTLLEKNIHHFDLMVSLLNKRPVSVTAKGRDDTTNKQSGMLDQAWVVVEFEEGIFANLGVSMSHFEHHLEFGVLSKNARFIYHPNKQKLAVWSESGAETQTFPAKITGVDAGGFDHPGEVEQMQEFVRNIRCKSKDKTVFQEVYWSHLIAFAAENSVITGKTLHITSDGEII